MAVDRIDSLARGPDGAHSGTLTSALQTSVSNLLNLGSNYLDRFFPPEKREIWKLWLTTFANERPYLAGFLLSQIALSGPALALFLIMAITVFVFSLTAGILVGLLGALLFTAFAVGVALIFLLPVLFFTTTSAVFLWFWGVSAYNIIGWLNQKYFLSIPTDVGSIPVEVDQKRDMSRLDEEFLGGRAPDLPKRLSPARAEREFPN